MERLFLLVGALSALTAVAAGAFGAHALRGRLGSDLLDVFETAARYQMYHALALIALGVFLGRAAVAASPWLTASGWCFITGTVLFSGSLYVLALTGVRWLGAITPLGGVALLIGWAAFALGVWRE